MNAQRIIVNEIITLENAPEVLQSFPLGKVDMQIWCIRLRQGERKSLPPMDFSPRGEVRAEVCHSRWIVKCPHCQGGAMIASRLDPVFWCCNCTNGMNGGQPMRVIFPAAADDIEAVLSERFDPATRNWLIGETVDQLVMENRQHGIGTPLWPGMSFPALNPGTFSMPVKSSALALPLSIHDLNAFLMQRGKH